MSTEQSVEQLAEREAVDLNTKRQGLIGCGYSALVGDYRIRVGQRVHHSGERWDEASWHGTATVLAVMENAGSAWSKSYGQRDIEVIVLRDKPLLEGMSRVTEWANYRTCEAAA
jgi:hypothetical protein